MGKIVDYKDMDWQHFLHPLVTANGCFDVIHPGHIELLRQAKSFGETLVVLLNSDDSVRRVKGGPRPYVDQDSRAKIVAALEFVDYVAIFDEDTPIHALCYIEPDIHVKGGDYVAEDLPEHNIVVKGGGIIKIVPLVEGFSVTNLIESIFASNGTMSLDDIAAVVDIDDEHDWGREHRLINNEFYCCKLLEYQNKKPGSLHYHKVKHETFKVLKGEVYVTRLYKPGESIDMPQLTEHQMRAKTPHAVIIEASTHHDDGDTYRVDEEVEHGV